MSRVLKLALGAALLIALLLLGWSFGHSGVAVASRNALPDAASVVTRVRQLEGNSEALAVDREDFPNGRGVWRARLAGSREIWLDEETGAFVGLVGRAEGLDRVPAGWVFDEKSAISRARAAYARYGMNSDAFDDADLATMPDGSLLVVLNRKDDQGAIIGSLSASVDKLGDVANMAANGRPERSSAGGTVDVSSAQAVSSVEVQLATEPGLKVSADPVLTVLRDPNGASRRVWQVSWAGVRGGDTAEASWMLVDASTGEVIESTGGWTAP